ncbi:MAG: MBL fold metallo-hydrolase [Lachnospiraceae bacterium]|nr:MBL fold metallo-hydrolase [Lachnospiraceae bacterium]
MLGTNCYVAVSDRTKGAFIVDPGGDAAEIMKKIAEAEALPEAVLLTHGHFDHILAADELRKAYQIPVYAGKDEDPVLSDPVKNLSALYSEPAVLEPDRKLSDGEVLKIGGLEIRVIGTPGHSVGSVSYYMPREKVLFSGDTLFHESYGRVNDRDEALSIRDSIIEKLFELPDDTVVYPGHLDCTTIRHEKVYNPIYYTI